MVFGAHRASQEPGDSGPPARGSDARALDGGKTEMGELWSASETGESGMTGNIRVEE